MIHVLFGEVRFTEASPSPVLILREAEGLRELAVWVTAGAAAAILASAEEESEDHPSTHGLLLESLASQSAQVETLDILAVSDEGVFTAHLRINGIDVACRVSDGVALALRCGASIRVAESVFAEYGLLPLGEGDVASADDSDEMAQFRAFLADVNADDFDAPPA